MQILQNKKNNKKIFILKLFAVTKKPKKNITKIIYTEKIKEEKNEYIHT